MLARDARARVGLSWRGRFDELLLAIRILTAFSCTRPGRKVEVG
jgi:hypothetical protein